MKNLMALSLLFLGSLSNHAQDNRVEVIDKYLSGQFNFFRFNGNVLVAEKRKIIYQKSFGVSNFSNRKPLNDLTVFDIASISKQFTAMSILLLVKEGKLKLSDSLRKFFPNLPYTGVTLHHMLSHTSGLPDTDDLMEAKWDHQKIAFNNDVISLLEKEKPSSYFKPGIKWKYCNTGYTLLASIIENVSGVNYSEFLKKNIFVPLRMTRSGIFINRDGLSNFAYGFVWSNSLNRLISPDSLSEYKFVYFFSGILGGGKICSTTGDLLKWINHLTSKVVQSDTLLRKISQPHSPADFGSYGYGIYVGKNNFGDNISHSGHWAGYETNLTHYFDGARTIIVLSNDNSRAAPIQRAIASILFDKEIIQPYDHKTVKLDSVSLDAFTGTYSNKSMTFKIVREKQSLYQILNSGLRRPLSPESKSKLFTTDKSDWLDLQFEIVKEQTKAPKYYQIRFGVKEEMEKVN